VDLLTVGVIVYVATACVASALLFLPAAALAEALPPGRPVRESSVWFAVLVMPHLLALTALAYAVRMHALDPVLWTERNRLVRHLCFLRWAESPDAAYRTWFLGGCAGLLVLVGLAVPVASLILSWRQSGALATTSKDVPELAVGLVPLGSAWSACVGILRPRVYVTQGLAARLNAQELGAVIAHEGGHANRRDNLRLVVAQALFGPTVAIPTAHLAYRRLRAAIERAADQAAMRSAEGQGLTSALASVARKLREESPAAEERGWRARLAARHRDEFIAQRIGLVESAGSDERATSRRVALGVSAGIIAALVLAGAPFIGPTVRCLFETMLLAVGE
jgi:Zn-dependent protease with chaperone function